MTTARLPFAPGGPFIARIPFTMEGINYGVGEEVPVGDSRLERVLYNARRIDMTESRPLVVLRDFILCGQEMKVGKVFTPDPEKHSGRLMTMLVDQRKLGNTDALVSPTKKKRKRRRRED